MRGLEDISRSLTQKETPGWYGRRVADRSVVQAFGRDTAWNGAAARRVMPGDSPKTA
jgi:hypothetical protein